MKRYTVIGEPVFDFIEDKEGDVVFYEDFSVFISWRIKELETEIDNEDSIYSEASCRFRIDELKNLLK